jgi:hypothetical protein
MISVTQHRTVTFEISVDPDNWFRYDSSSGHNKTFFTPGRVRIAPDSDRLIHFKENGSVDVAASIVLESDVSGSRERWTAAVNTMGTTTLAHERVN